MGRILGTAIAALLLACSGNAKTNGTTPGDPPEANGRGLDRTGHEVFGFPVYPGSRQFCNGHVTGAPGSGHITWSSFSTPDSRAAVLAHYEATLSPDSGVTRADENTWRIPPSETEPNRVLSVESPGGKGPWTTCDVPDGARAIIMISQLVR